MGQRLLATARGQPGPQRRRVTGKVCGVLEIRCAQATQLKDTKCPFCVDRLAKMRSCGQGQQLILRSSPPRSIAIA